MTEDKKKANHYVDKQALYADLCEWKIRKDTAIAEGRKAPPLPDSVGDAIMKVAEGQASRPNFRNYTYIEEMKGEGIIAAVRAMNSFDPKRLGKNGEVNPFGFISLCVWRAFLGYIAYEKKLQKTKMDMMTDPVNEFFSTQDGDYGHYIDNYDVVEFMNH
ncbi:RNA polymerase sigma factor [Xanthomonas phage BUDD]|nr:RNA polymerase sigma factor [Xanthomonas phage BUDD]